MIYETQYFQIMVLIALVLFILLNVAGLVAFLATTMAVTQVSSKATETMDKIQDATEETKNATLLTLESSTGFFELISQIFGWAIKKKPAKKQGVIKGILSRFL